MTTRVRRIGFGTALATGLSLIGLSVGGMASLDADLRAAAEQRAPQGERVRVVDDGIGSCHRRWHRRDATSGREI
jgi:hypothetical protein